jgi:hypothetical protein
LDDWLIVHSDSPPSGVVLPKLRDLIIPMSLNSLPAKFGEPKNPF